MRYILTITLALSISPTYALSFVNMSNDDMYFKVNFISSCASKIKDVSGWLHGGVSDPDSWGYGMALSPIIPENCVTAGRTTVEFNKNAGKKAITVKDCEIIFHQGWIAFSDSCQVADA